MTQQPPAATQQSRPAPPMPLRRAAERDLQPATQLRSPRTTVTTSACEHCRDWSQNLVNQYVYQYVRPSGRSCVSNIPGSSVVPYECGRTYRRRHGDAHSVRVDVTLGIGVITQHVHYGSPASWRVARCRRRLLERYCHVGPPP